MARNLHNKKEHHIILKLDILKPFDLVSWCGFTHASRFCSSVIWSTSCYLSLEHGFWSMESLEK